MKIDIYTAGGPYHLETQEEVDSLLFRVPGRQLDPFGSNFLDRMSDLGFLSFWQEGRRHFIPMARVLRVEIEEEEGELDQSRKPAPAKPKMGVKGL